MLGEPPPTEYDWKFELFGIPVRVHPFFWLVTVLLGLKGGSDGLVIWVPAVFLSILVHEFGHAFAIRHFGWSPRVVLYGFGGLAIHDSGFSSRMGGRRPRDTPQSSVLISLAGPAAGFALAAMIVLLIFVSRRYVGEYPVFGFLIPLGISENPPITNLQLVRFIADLLYINIYWGLLNLLPVYPLDGGQVARELFLYNSNDGLRMSLQLSMVTAIVLAVMSFTQFGSQYMAFMFGYLAYQNFQQLNGPFGGHRW